MPACGAYQASAGGINRHKPAATLAQPGLAGLAGGRLQPLQWARQKRQVSGSRSFSGQGLPARRLVHRRPAAEGTAASGSGGGADWPSGSGAPADDSAAAIDGVLHFLRKLAALQAEGLCSQEARRLLLDGQQAALWCGLEDFLTNLQLLRNLLEQHAQQQGHVESPATCSISDLTPVGVLLLHSGGTAATFLARQHSELEQLLRWLESRSGLGLSRRDLAACSQLLQALAVPADGTRAGAALLLQELTLEMVRSLFLARPGLFSHMTGSPQHPLRLAPQLWFRVAGLAAELRVDFQLAARLAVQQPRLLDDDVASELDLRLDGIADFFYYAAAQVFVGRVSFSGCEARKWALERARQVVIQEPALAVLDPTLLRARLEPVLDQLGLGGAAAAAAAAAAAMGASRQGLQEPLGTGAAAQALLRGAVGDATTLQEDGKPIGLGIADGNAAATAPLPPAGSQEEACRPDNTNDTSHDTMIDTSESLTGRELPSIDATSEGSTSCEKGGTETRDPRHAVSEEVADALSAIVHVLEEIYNSEETARRFAQEVPALTTCAPLHQQPRVSH